MSPKIWIATVLLALLIVGGAVFLVRMNAPQSPAQPQQVTSLTKAEPFPEKNRPGGFAVSIPALAAGGRLPLEYTCFRAHISPQVEWSGAPRGTKSFAVFMERRTPGEAPYITWALFNIPADTDGLPRDLPKMPELEDGMRHARADSGAAEYAGPCQPEGKIPYILRVIALDAMIDLPPAIPVADLSRAVEGHVLATAETPFIHFLRP